MGSEQIYNWGLALKIWAECAFWIAGTVICLTGAYRFLLA